MTLVIPIEHLDLILLAHELSSGSQLGNIEGTGKRIILLMERTGHKHKEVKQNLRSRLQNLSVRHLQICKVKNTILIKINYLILELVNQILMRLKGDVMQIINDLLFSFDHILTVHQIHNLSSLGLQIWNHLVLLHERNKHQADRKVVEPVKFLVA